MQPKQANQFMAQNKNDSLSNLTIDTDSSLLQIDTYASTIDMQRQLDELIEQNKQLQAQLIAANANCTQLDEEREVYLDFYNNHPEGLFRIREVGGEENSFLEQPIYRVEIASDKICELTGLDRLILLSMPLNLNDIIAPTHRESFTKAYTQSRNNMQPFSWEGQLIANTKALWVRVEVCPRRIKQNVIVWQGILYDITEQRETKDTLSKTQLQLTDVIEGAKVGTLEWNVKTGKINFNRIWAENLGYSPFEIKVGQAFLGKNGWKSITHPDDIPYAEEMLNRHFSGELPYHRVDVRMRHKKGHWVWIRQEGKVKTWTEDGKPLLMYGLHMDVTAQKQAEEALNALNEQLEHRINERTAELTSLNKSLRETEVKFQTLTEFTYDWEYWRSPENKIVFMTPSVERITGYTVSQFEEHPQLLDEIVHPDDLHKWDEHKKARCNHRSKQNNIDLTFRIITRTGEVRWLSHVCRCILIDNEHLGVRVSNRDITDKIHADNKLLNITVEVEERERNRFSREIHDGMGPLLSTIKLYFQWLADTSDSEKRTLITQKGNHSIEMAIQTSRELARGLGSQYLTEIGFVPAISEFIQQINDTGKNTIKFTTNTDNRFNAFMELMLYRISTELLKNAINYAQASSIELNFEQDSEKQTITLTYTDNGIGIDLEKVTSERKGLGLLNIKHRVLIMKGTIEMTSAVGKGLEVKINLPIEN